LVALATALGVDLEVVDFLAYPYPPEKEASTRFPAVSARAASPNSEALAYWAALWETVVGIDGRVAEGLSLIPVAGIDKAGDEADLESESLVESSPALVEGSGQARGVA
jgi:hypothetical protein